MRSPPIVVTATPPLMTPSKNSESKRSLSPEPGHKAENVGTSNTPYHSKTLSNGEPEPKAALPLLAEIPQGCSSKFLTLSRAGTLVVASFGSSFAGLRLVGSEPVGVAVDVEYHALV